MLNLIIGKLRGWNQSRITWRQLNNLDRAFKFDIGLDGHDLDDLSTSKRHNNQ